MDAGPERLSNVKETKEETENCMGHVLIDTLLRNQLSACVFLKAAVGDAWHQLSHTGLVLGRSYEQVHRWLEFQ